MTIMKQMIVVIFTLCFASTNVVAQDEQSPSTEELERRIKELESTLAEERAPRSQTIIIQQTQQQQQVNVPVRSQVRLPPPRLVPRLDLDRLTEVELTRYRVLSQMQLGRTGPLIRLIIGAAGMTGSVFAMAETCADVYDDQTMTYEPQDPSVCRAGVGVFTLTFIGSGILTVSGVMKIISRSRLQREKRRLERRATIMINAVAGGGSFRLSF
jgi:hypothetical protein